MTLTLVIGSSGSGKTTFLNDLVTFHKHGCIYIRQFHTIRPYSRVSQIPNFDPTQLPYWHIYLDEQTAETIPVGGTMAGKFIPGLSGGQRKLLLFELICQRTVHHPRHPFLIVLDEPFSGVTSDFLSFIEERLSRLRERHNVILVTNDHLETLTRMADNVVQISAAQRHLVELYHPQRHPPTVSNPVQDNFKQQDALAKLVVSRTHILHALSLGHAFHSYSSPSKLAASSSPWWSFCNHGDAALFWKVELWSNRHLRSIGVVSTIFVAFFLASFWDSDPSQRALVLVAGDILAFFCVNPYLLTLVDWRNAIEEESHALIHTS